MGIEPTYAAWEAAVLPLNYTRTWRCMYHTRPVFSPGASLGLGAFVALAGPPDLPVRVPRTASNPLNYTRSRQES